jgi:hypothetical protein
LPERPRKGGVENGLLTAAKDFPAIEQLANVEAVAQQIRERAEPNAPPPMVRPFARARCFVRMPRWSSSCASARTDPSAMYLVKIMRTMSASSGTTASFLAIDA